MNIKEIRMRKATKEGIVKAFASINFDDAFVVHGVKVLEKDDKRYVAMPSVKRPDGKFRDMAHPLNTDVRDMITEAVLAEYDKLEE